MFKKAIHRLRQLFQRLADAVMTRGLLASQWLPPAVFPRSPRSSSNGQKASSTEFPADSANLVTTIFAGETIHTPRNLASLFRPAHQISPTGALDYDWLSKGDDPQLHLASGSFERREGWYLIELCMRCNTSGVARLYVDIGKGYTDAHSVVLPWRNNRLLRRVIYLSAAPKRMRLDPLDGAGRFSVVRFLCVRLTPLMASLEMEWRLGDLTPSESSPGRLGAQQPTILYDRYNESFQAWLRGSENYQEWISRIETSETSSPETLASEQAAFRHRPIISIVFPTYNTAEHLLRQAIDSVKAQSYTAWELCIADDASSQPHVRTVLAEYAQNDPRIRIAYRNENGRVAAASNSALALATGEYIALMDHDDVLPCHSLHFVVQALNRHPSAQILYSDEDKIDEHGNRQDPYFKPDWNPDLFFAMNYVSHLGVYRRDLLQRIGGFRNGVDGSQDYDLLLRCLPHVSPDAIVHIPKVLYHWRMVPGSTALNAEQKTYTTQAGIQALHDFFDAQGRTDIVVEPGNHPTTYRIRHPIPSPAPFVSLLIPTRDRLDLLERCVGSILGKTTYPHFEIIIIDNDSSLPETHDYFRLIQATDSRVTVLSYPFPFNYSAINNYAVRYAKGQLIGLINNDTEIISPEWLNEMASQALRPDIGCVGAKLYYADGTIQHAGLILGIQGIAGHCHLDWPAGSLGYHCRLSIIQNYSALTAACLLIR
ncbi:MAG: glycosyltransferase, partial [Planctomycetota bacterium]